MSYIAIPAASLEEFLAAKKFTRTICGREVCYVRCSKRNPSVKIKVYTSIRIDAGAVRAKGKDAIRVCAAFEEPGKSFGLYKTTRTFRTGTVEKVLARIESRIRETAAFANDWITREEANIAQKQLAKAAQAAKWEAEKAARAARSAGATA